MFESLVEKNEKSAENQRIEAFRRLHLTRTLTLRKMKKSILFAVALLFGCGLAAQESNAVKTTKEVKSSVEKVERTKVDKETVKKEGEKAVKPVMQREADKVVSPTDSKKAEKVVNEAKDGVQRGEPVKHGEAEMRKEGKKAVKTSKTEMKKQVKE